MRINSSFKRLLEIIEMLKEDKYDKLAVDEKQDLYTILKDAESHMYPSKEEIDKYEQCMALLESMEDKESEAAKVLLEEIKKYEMKYLVKRGIIKW